MTIIDFQPSPVLHSYSRISSKIVLLNPILWLCSFKHDIIIYMIGVLYQHLIIFGWCSFMHIIDYGIISSCVLTHTDSYPWFVLIHAYHYYLYEWVSVHVYQTNIIDYGIIRLCALNTICRWCSFMHIIIIYMYNYQCSRVTVAVTEVCN